MRNVARAKWIARFDMENLISALLQNGIMVSIALIVVFLAVRCIENKPWSFQGVLQAKSLPLLFWADFQQFGVPERRPDLLLHLSVATLLLLPYIRVVTSMVYFAVVERSWRHALITFFVVVILTITLLTAWV